MRADIIGNTKMTYIYFLLVRLAALLGNRKAKLLTAGQSETIARIQQDELTRTQNTPRDSRSCGSEVRLWIHAASVGEFEQVRPIIERLKTNYPQTQIILTFFSPSGYELRKDYDKADGVYYLPFATRKNAKKFIELLRPDMAIFVKYEFWPAYLKELKANGIPTYLISAIFRPSQLFFRPWGKPYLKLLTCFAHLFVQDENSKVLLEKHGIGNVSIAGDTRFDRVSEIKDAGRHITVVEEFLNDTYALPYEQAHMTRQPVIVAGSTWQQDELLLARYLEHNEDVKLIIAPHEITEEHLNFLFHLFEGRYVRYSEATHENISRCRILLIDSIGMLSSLYRYATVAYVGGAFGKGLHNTIEAAVWGVPVVFGKKYKHFREAVGLIKAGAAVSVRNSNELNNALDYTISQSRELGEKAAEYVESELGATDKIYNYLMNAAPF